MGWQLLISKPAQRDFLNLPKPVQARVQGAIQGLGENIHPPGSVKLQGYATMFRIRVGDYRIIYDFNPSTNTVSIGRIRHRREVYRGI